MGRNLMSLREEGWRHYMSTQYGQYVGAADDGGGGVCDTILLQGDLRLSDWLAGIG